MRSYLKAPELWHSVGYVIVNDMGYLVYEKVSAGNAYLSVREAEVLQKLCQGATNKVIAIDLDITPATVSNHIRSLLKKYRINELNCLIMNSPITQL